MIVVNDAAEMVLRRRDTLSNEQVAVVHDDKKIIASKTIKNVGKSGLNYARRKYELDGIANHITTKSRINLLHIR